MQESTALNWDDVRFILALSAAGSLAGAAKRLGVDHTTVGRRVEAAERALGVRLFLRGPRGFTRTADGDRLLGPMRAVEDATLALTRAVALEGDGLSGAVRLTSPETFGVAYLAPRLAEFGLRYPDLRVELMPSGQVLDLDRGEAEVALRFFRSRGQNLVVQRVAEVAYGLYASRAYLAENPAPVPEGLSRHRLLLPPPGAPSLEGEWLKPWLAGTRPVFVSELSLALMAVAKADGGITALPRYLGDAEPDLQRLPMPHAPVETLWLTLHEDARKAPRVRALTAYLAGRVRKDELLLRGQTGS